MGWTPRALWRTSAADKSIWKFLLPFYPVFSWVISCHLGRKPPYPEDYSKPVAILTGIHLLALSQDGATTLPGRRIFYFFFQSSSNAAALMSTRYVDGFLIHYPVCFPGPSEFNHFAASLVSAEGKTFQSPWCCALEVDTDPI